MRKKLKEARKKQKLSVDEISVLLNISKSFYYKIESGIRNPTIEKAKEISSILGYSVDELFFEEKMDLLSNL